ncbi:POTRA domain-containing protein [Danxiaibacter flavus]|uniref:POTRA domain-containing protein n=1 Tax=Danxiaibacter flavus TaxID=3049108 RepID=A0ABV3ZLI2_9BACT|nr:POTRA domain-containing protein [Chitinophagaceae bacterium DXS]
MYKLCKILVLASIASFVSSAVSAQVPGNQSDTTITSINADLLNIFNQKVPKKYKIAKVVVTGNKYFDQALLLSVAGLHNGDEIVIPGGDNFSKAINKLWSQNYFSDVEIYLTRLEGNNIDVEIAVTERPRLAKYYFKGVKKGDQEELTKKTGLVLGRVVTENMKRTAIDGIEKYYYEKGFRAVKVRIDEKRDTTSANSLVLNFMIDKGSKVRINNINFGGNTVNEQKLKAQMKGTKEMSRLTLFPTDDKGGLFDPKHYTFQQYIKDNGYLTFTKTRRVLDPYIRLKFFSSAKFDDKKYEEDKEKIIQYYNSLGYRDANIEKDMKYYNSKGNMNIDLKVNEGDKYYFGNITWRGNTKYSDSILTAILNIKKGDIYNLDILNKKLGKSVTPEGGDISGLYMDDGYLFFQTNPVETRVYNDTIDYEIRMMEGPQATIKHVTISGNEKTKEYVIRRELRTMPGEKFSRTDLIRSQRELANLGYFNQEKINPNVVPDQADGTVDINWSLEEKSSDQLELSAGFGGGIGLTGTLGVTFNNFSIRNILHKEAWDPLPMGDGQKLSVRVQSNGRAYRSYNLSFTEPWLGGKRRNSLSFNIYDTKFSNAYDPVTRTYTRVNANNSYFKTTGASIGLGKQLKWPDDYFSLTFALSYVRYHLHNYVIDYTLKLPDGSIFNNGYSNNLSLKVALQRSSISSPIFPTSGSNFLASLQLTPPYSLMDPSLTKSANPYQWIEYHKWKFTGEWYVPIGKPGGPERNKQLVLKAAAKYGFLGRYNPDLQVSPFERFQVGDAGISNSYALLGYDIIAHRGYPVYQTSDPTVNPDQSGASQYFTMFNKYTVELRYPLSLNPSSTIYGLTFFEAANGWYSFKDYNPFRLRRSVGVGMRFFLPMFGLLGFDYGIGLDRITPGGSLKDAAKFTFMLGFEPE